MHVDQGIANTACLEILQEKIKFGEINSWGNKIPMNPSGTFIYYFSISNKE